MQLTKIFFEICNNTKLCIYFIRASRFLVLSDVIFVCKSNRMRIKINTFLIYIKKSHLTKELLDVKFTNNVF